MRRLPERQNQAHSAEIHHHVQGGLDRVSEPTVQMDGRMTKESTIKLNMEQTEAD